MISKAKKKKIWRPSSHPSVYIEEKKQRDVIQEVKNVGKNGEFMKRLILLIPPWFCVGIVLTPPPFLPEKVDVYFTTASRELLLGTGCSKKQQRSTSAAECSFKGGNISPDFPKPFRCEK